MSNKTIFTKILNGEIQGNIIYQDDDVFCLKDIYPQATHHYLLITKKEIPTVNDVEDADIIALGKLFIAAKKVAKELGIDQSGYRLTVNCNSDAGQEVYHIHMHLLGGNKLGSMV